MRKQQRLGGLKAFVTMACSALLLGACAHTAVAARSDVSADVPLAAQSVFVGPFSGEFQRELRDEIFAELQKSRRYRVVDTEAAADYVLSGSILFRRQPTPGPEPTQRYGNVQLLSRASGTYVWQSSYQDQRNGAAFVVPTGEQQAREIGRQLVAQLLSATFARSADQKATF